MRVFVCAVNLICWKNKLTEIKLSRWRKIGGATGRVVEKKRLTFNIYGISSLCRVFLDNDSQAFLRHVLSLSLSHE